MENLKQYKEEVKSLAGKGYELREACEQVALKVVKDMNHLKGISDFNEWVKALEAEIECDAV